MRKRVRVRVTQSKDLICNHIKTEKSCEILTFEEDFSPFIING